MKRTSLLLVLLATAYAKSMELSDLTAACALLSICEKTDLELLDLLPDDHSLDNKDAVDASTFQPSYTATAKDKKGSLKCGFCAFETIYPASLRNHLDKHVKKGLYTCKFCTFSSIKKIGLLKHTATVHRPNK
jgi:hypothetical protein